jgi:hypothetical protein
MKFENQFEPSKVTASQEKPKYTTTDLEDVKQRMENYMGPNNPKAQSRAYAEFGRQIKEIQEYLISTGELKKEVSSERELSEAELMNKKLDELYPNAKSKTIVWHEGQRYQIKYYPHNTSNSGKTVYEWRHSWTRVEEKKKKS